MNALYFFEHFNTPQLHTTHNCVTQLPFGNSLGAYACKFAGVLGGSVYIGDNSCNYAGTSALALGSAACYDLGTQTGFTSIGDGSWYVTSVLPDTQSNQKTHSYRLLVSNAEGACRTTRDSDFANAALEKGNNDCNTAYSCNVSTVPATTTTVPATTTTVSVSQSAISVFII